MSVGARVGLACGRRRGSPLPSPRGRRAADARFCALGRRHVPDRAPAPRPHPRPAVDREAPAAATRVGAGEAEHGPPPGDRGGEPLLAEPALPHGRAGARPRGGPPGGRLPGAQGGAGVQVPRVPAAGGPARPPQGHREVVLTRATPPASCGDEREPLAGAPRSPGQAERVPATAAPGPRSPPPAVCLGRVASRFSCPEDGTGRRLRLTGCGTQPARSRNKAADRALASGPPCEILPGALPCMLAYLLPTGLA